MRGYPSNRHFRQLLFIAAIWMTAFGGLRAQHSCRTLNDPDYSEIFSAIYGCVDDETGLYLPGVRVELRNTESSEVQVTHTNETGVYRSDCPDNGIHELVFSAKGFETHAVLELKFLNPGARRLDQVMYLAWEEPGASDETALWIRVVDEDGHPIPGAAGGIDDFPIGSFRTVECGCTYEYLTPGRHILRIQKEGYEEKTVPIDVEGRFMNIEVVLHRLPVED